MPIQIEQITYVYMPGSALAQRALEDISLTIEEGEFLGIIGHTGSGKSTFVQLIGGLLQPASGRVMVDGMDMADKKQRTQARRRVGLVFQYPEYQLFEEPVARDIAYGPRNMGMEENEIEAAVHEAMELVGLPYKDFSDKSPFELSGGEKRRAALAGVIAMRPKYLILDEPMAGLDPAGRFDILSTIDSLRSEIGCAVVMVSHSMEDVARCAGRIAVLSHGRVVRIGEPAEVFAQGEELKAMGLDLPAACKLAAALRERGMDVPPLYEMDALASFLLERGLGHV